MSHSIKFDYKLIRDPIHGYIHLSEPEYEILQTNTFNRLHKIKMDGARYMVYPSSTNSRFTHSIGTMFIASKIVNKLLTSPKSEEIIKEIGFEPDNDYKQYITQTVRFAALLHDIGHGPFSHVSENVLSETMDPSEKDEAKDLFDTAGSKKIYAHEYFSYKIIEQNEEISSILKKVDQEMPNDVSSLIIKKNVQNTVHLNNKMRNLLRKIISSYVDADRMDYLLRDSYFSGSVYGLIDYDRIIDNMILCNNQEGEPDIVFESRAINALEDFADARFKMYKWVYNHHLIVALDTLLGLGLTALVEKGIVDKEDLKWNKYESTDYTDEVILYLLKKMIDKDPNYRLKDHTYPKGEGMALYQLRGLVDRRFAPISLLKNQIDKATFNALLISKIEAKIGTRGDPNDRPKVVKDALDKWNNSNPSGVGGDYTLFFLDLPFSPYSALKEKINIREPTSPCYLSDEEKKANKSFELHSDIKNASSYFKKIDQEWEEFRNFHFFYVYGKSPKAEGKEHSREIQDKLVEEIVKAYTESLKQ